MNINRIEEEIPTLSQQVLKDLLDVVEKYERLVEINPTDQPVPLSSDAYGYGLLEETLERTMLRKLESWDVLEFHELDSGVYSTVLLIDLQELRDIKKRLLKCIGKPDVAENETLIVWPDSFKFNEEETKFIVPDGKSLPFGKNKKNTTKEIFKFLFRKRDWAEVSEMAGSLDIKDKNVRAVKGNLTKKIAIHGLGSYLGIESKGVKPGAYRLIPFPEV